MNASSGLNRCEPVGDVEVERPLHPARQQQDVKRVEDTAVAVDQILPCQRPALAMFPESLTENDVLRAGGAQSFGRLPDNDRGGGRVAWPAGYHKRPFVD